MLTIKKKKQMTPTKTPPNLYFKSNIVTVKPWGTHLGLVSLLGCAMGKALAFF